MCLQRDAAQQARYWFRCVCPCRYADNIAAFSTLRYAPQPLVVQGPGAGAAVTAAGIYADFLKIAKSC